MPHTREHTPGLGEAILRSLGGFAENVGGQIQANQLFNQDLARRTGIEQQESEAEQLQREIENAFAERRLAVQEQPTPEKPLTIAQEKAELFRTDIDKYFDVIRRESEAAAAGKAKAPAKLTLPQRGSLVDRRIKETRARLLGESGESSIADLQEASTLGLGQTRDTRGAFRQFLTEPGEENLVPDPDSAAFNILQNIEQAGSNEARLAILDSIQKGQIFPELGLGEQPPPNDGTLSDSEYQEFVQLWRARQGQ